MTDPLSFLLKYEGLKILVAPLCWGLGHATRCLPIIDILERKNEVIIASDGVSLDWLKKEKPSLSFIKLPSYDVRYVHQAMWLNMLFQGPKLLKSIHAENEMIIQLVSDLNVDIVISDHRLGVRADGVQNILIAHQLCLPHKNYVFRWLATKFQKNFVNAFDEIWIPDYQGSESLSGTLSKVTLRSRKRYIGPLSRFKKNESIATSYDLAIILSGPEPARTKLEEVLIKILPNHGTEKIIFVRGSNLPISEDHTIAKNIKMINLAGTSELEEILLKSAVILCRSGYSSIMDLHKLEKSAILIPTPNQPEQEYLALLNGSKDQFYVLQQAELSETSLQRSFDYFQSPSK